MSPMPLIQKRPCYPVALPSFHRGEALSPGTPLLCKTKFCPILLSLCNIFRNAVEMMKRGSGFKPAVLRH